MTAHAIDVSKGACISTVSNQWATRADDEKFTSLGALRDQVASWKDASFTKDFAPRSVSLITDKDDTKALRCRIGDGPETNLTPYAFDRLAQVASSPASYLRKLPAALAAANLRYGLLTADQDDQSAYLMDDGETSLRGITSTKYGRIHDVDVVDEVMKLAGQGTGDTRWKVPGTIDWAGAGISYNPAVDITTQNTTLYASDRDIFLFLVDDMNPIEVGKLDNGDPDLMFRGFYAWNSEVGCRSFGLATMYLRGVCQNRNLWGVEGFNEVTFRHTAGAPNRFMAEAAPALQSFAEGDSKLVIAGVNAAKTAIVSKDTDERVDFLQGFGFSRKQAMALIGIGEAEEGHAPTSVWDHAQAVTALARRQTLNETRMALEVTAGKMLDKVTA
jgi:hypothetical protein